MPAHPNFKPPLGVEVQNPVVSVIPKASRSSMPQLKYQRIKSGGTGAAPVSAFFTFCIPKKIRTFRSATQFKAR